MRRMLTSDETPVAAAFGVEIASSSRIQKSHLIKTMELINRCRSAKDFAAVDAIAGEIAGLMETETALQTCTQCCKDCTTVPTSETSARAQGIGGAVQLDRDQSAASIAAATENEKTLLDLGADGFTICHFPARSPKPMCLQGNQRPGSTRTERYLLMTYLLPHLHSAYLQTCGGLRQARRTETPSQPAITTREDSVLHWMVMGKTNWEISQILQISERTVKFHLKNIFRKLNAVNRVQAVTKARDLGF